MTGDRWITRLIAVTVCLLAVIVTVTACTLFFREVAVPDPLDRLVTFLLGGLVGRLTASSTKDPLPVAVEPAEPADDRDHGAGEVRTILLYAAGGLLALVLFYFVALPLSR